MNTPPQRANKKVLILYSSSGGGHLTAAKNIKQALELIGDDLEITIKDSYQFIHPFKKWQYTKGWQLVTTFAPGPYRHLRNRVVHSAGAVRQLKKGFLGGAAKLDRYLADQPVSAIIATHAHAAGIAGILKSAPYNKDFYLAQIYTDYQFHAFYQNQNVDHYFAPAEWVAVQLRKANQTVKITASGAPINVCFGLKDGPEAARRKFGVASDGRLVVLVTRGSFGWGNRKNLEIVRTLASSGLPLHILAHAGKNKKLAGRMFKIARESKSDKSSLRVLGWVNNMYELMEMSDIYVGKPGGMQVAEAMAQGTPLLVFDPMPGQEDANVDFILAQKVGALISRPQDAVDWVARFVENPSLLGQYRERALELGGTDGALVTAREVLKDLGWLISSEEPNLKGCIPGPPST